MDMAGTFLGEQQQGHEPDHSPSSSADIKNSLSCNSIPASVFMARRLIRDRGNFTF
jgi:hypothetical protein